MTKGTGKEPRITCDLLALIDSEERDHALDALREGGPADAMADTVERLFVAPLMEWIDSEYQRTGKYHAGALAGMRLLSAAEEIVYRCRHDQTIVPEHFDALAERWTAWLPVMAQGGASLQRQAQEARDAARAKGGKNKKGKEEPLTATVRAMLAVMDDKRTSAVLAEMEADADGRESVLTGLRESGKDYGRFTDVTTEDFTFTSANGKTKTRTFKALQNLISKIKPAPQEE